MAHPLTIEKQRFTFGESWETAFKFDDSNFYREKVEKAISGTKAVDVVALRTGTGLVLLEVKDFRGYRIANKVRLKHGELAMEVAQKVRDTVAALLGASRSRISQFAASSLAAQLNSSEKLVVVLWIEDDAAVNLLSWKVQLDDINMRLKKLLGWLGPLRTVVLSGKTENELPDLKVANLPRAASSDQAAG